MASSPASLDFTLDSDESVPDSDFGLLHLPLEVIRTIIGFISIEIIFKTGTDLGESIIARNTLCDISMTCRLLRTLGQEHLFSRVRADNSKRLALLIRSIIERPDLSQYIRHLYVGCYPSEVCACIAGLEALDLGNLNLSHLSNDQRKLLARCIVSDRRRTFQHLVAFLLICTTHLERLLISVKRTWARSNRNEGIEAFISVVLTDASHQPVLPSLHHLEIKSEFNQHHNFAIIPACPFFVPSLLTLPALKILSIPCDDGKWRLFDDIRPSQPFAFEDLCLHGSSTSGSNLSRLLRRCPGLRTLTVAIEFDVSHEETYLLSAQHVRISDVLPDFCPSLHTLNLQFRGFRGFFVEGESRLRRLVDMKELSVLCTDLPALFEDTDDMRNAYLEERFPPNLTELELHDMWYDDDRSQVKHTCHGECAIYIRTHGKVDASVEALTSMLLHLASISSRLMPKLRSVRVKSPSYDHDSGKTSSSLFTTFADVGIDFQIIPSHGLDYCPLHLAGASEDQVFALAYEDMPEEAR